VTHSIARGPTLPNGDHNGGCSQAGYVFSAGLDVGAHGVVVMVVQAQKASAELQPQPTLHDLDALLEEMRGAGLVVDRQSRVSRASWPRASTARRTGSCWHPRSPAG